MSVELDDDELPCDIEAERFVCGAVIADDTIYHDVAAKCSSEDFYSLQYRKLWQRICEWISFDEGTLDFHVLRTYLKDCDELELFPLANDAVDAFNGGLACNALWYADRIRERSLQRQLLKLKNQIGEKATKETPAEVLLKIRSVVEELTGKLPQALVDNLNVICDRVMETIKMRADNGGELQGLSTGLRDLDELINGFRPGQLILIGARPGMGKTQLALNMLWAGQLRKPNPEIVPTVFFTLEMSKDEIIERLLAQLSPVAFQLIKTGKIYSLPQDMKLLQHGIELLQQLKLTLFDETDNVSTVQKLEARLRSLPEPPQLIVIDYLSYLRSARRDGNKVLEVEEIVMDLKRLSVRMGVPIILLSQLSRAVEGRQVKRPMLADLRDSGGIEQAADVVLFIYREVMYSPAVDQHNIAELIIAKQRNGELGTAYVEFDKNTGIFKDLEKKPFEMNYSVDGEALKESSGSVRKHTKKGSTSAAHNQPEGE